MTILPSGSFDFTIPTADLARGLRPTSSNPRNVKFLTECNGAVGLDNVLQVLKNLNLEHLIDTALITSTFPYPQLFVFTNHILICTATTIYEYTHSSPGTLTAAITVDPGILWSAVDYYDYIYMSNCAAAVIRHAESGVWEEIDTISLPPCRAACNYNGQLVISPCEVILTPPAPPIPPQTLINWLSCPQAVTYIGDNLMFITTDDQSPIATASFNIWNGIYWEQIYTTIQTNTDLINDPLGTHWQWEEPEIDVYTRGNITVVALYREHYYATTDEFVIGADVFVFDGETLLNNVYIIGETIPAIAGPLTGITYCQHNLLIDIAGNIHLVMGSLNYDTYDYHVFDFISPDNGATFTPVDITDAQGFLGEPFFITSDSADTLYMCQNANTNCIWISSDNGATWAVHSNGAFKRFLKDFRILNDVFFAIDRNDLTHNVDIKRSTNGSTWATVHSIAKETTLAAGVLGYDGTYYYAICNYRDTVNPVGDTGYSEVYRSSDGLSWSMISTFLDYAIRPPTNFAVSNLATTASKLAYTSWYSEVITDGVRLMSVWESLDQGTTWTVISTLFSDQTGGTPP